MNPIQSILGGMIVSGRERVLEILANEDQGVLPFMINDNPLAIGEEDADALDVLLPFLEWHGFVVEDVLANLTDLRMWSVILTAQPANKSAEVPMLGGSNVRYMSVMEFNKYACNVTGRPDGTLGGMEQFNLVDEMYWWLRYLLRAIAGLTMVLPDDMDDDWFDEEE